MASGLWIAANLTCPEYTNERLALADTRRPTTRKGSSRQWRLAVQLAKGADLELVCRATAILARVIYTLHACYRLLTLLQVVVVLKDKARFLPVARMAHHLDPLIGR